MSAPGLPRTGLRFVRDLRATMPPELPRLRSRDLIARLLYAGCTFRVDESGQVWVRRRDIGSQEFALTPRLVRDWCRDLRLGVDPDDPDAGFPTDDADVAEAVCAEVAALVTAPSAARTFPRQGVDTSMARRLCGVGGARELLVRDGELRWRLRTSDPVRGGPGPLPELASDPAAGRAPVGLLQWGRRASAADDSEPVTVETVERVARAYVGPYDERPDWPGVVAALRALAGMPPEPAATEHAGPGTGWLRRRATP